MENRLPDKQRAVTGLVDLLLAEEDDDQGRKLALLLAVVVHLLLITVTLPTMMREPLQSPPPKPPVRISAWVPAPPPLRASIPTAQQTALQARKIPVPDPAPERPEPAMEPPLELTPRTAPSSVPIQLGAPQPPPAPPPAIFLPGLDGVSFPVLLKHTQVLPGYPRLARKAGVTGTVLLEAVVRTDGSVGDVKVLQTPGGHLGFAEAATKAVQQWRYRPGMQHGRPVAVRFTIILDFLLE
ncbi:MAG: energy transducer TonB [Acidobacteria bacterium]|nr:MAG: energy transducer TonB [Acidobacteriota bacterium]